MRTNSARETTATLIVLVVLASVIASATSAVWAHGPQLQITNEAGKIVTRNVFLDGPYHTLTPIRQAYVMPVLEFNGSWYSRPNNATDILGNPSFFSGPGLAYGLGATFAPDENFALTFADGLKRWNGAAYVDPGREQIQAFRGTPESPSAMAVTSDAGPFEALEFPTVAAGYDSEAHSSARFRLLGDGADPLSVSQDGVYLLTLQVTSTDSTLESSEPFYFVLHKNAPQPSVLAAVGALGVSAAQVQFVPEPGTLLLVVLALAAGALTTRRPFRI